MPDTTSVGGEPELVSPIVAEAGLPASKSAVIWMPAKRADAVSSIVAVPPDTRLGMVAPPADCSAVTRAAPVCARQEAPAHDAVVQLKPLDLSQPTVSHHLKVLIDAGLVTREKRGTWSWYTLVPERLDQVASLLP